MGLDQHAHLRGEQIDWKKYYSDDDDQENIFVWRKHARLQQFMATKWNEQNTSHKHEGDLGHLGFNGDCEAPCYMTEEVVKDLAEAISNDFKDYEATDGFFWGQQFQEEAIKEYKAQDEEFLKWAKEQVKAGRQIGYDCSW